MNDKIKAAFDAVHAGEELKSGTKAFIARKTRNYTMQKSPLRRKIIPAAAVCSALALFAGIKLYLTPTTHISIDINPSLDLGINYFDRVVSVEPLNDDGKKLVETLDIKFAAYDEALRKILDNKSVEALLSEDEILTVTVIETNTAQSANILSAVKECANDYDNVHCHSASPADASAAYKLGLSYERYLAYLELRTLDPEITPKIIQSMTMRELRELTGNICSDDDNGDHHDDEHSTAPESEHHENTGDDDGDHHDNSSSTTLESGHHGNAHGYGHN